MAASGHRINQLSGLALENSPKPRSEVFTPTWIHQLFFYPTAIIIMEDQIISALEVLSSASAESLGRIFLQNSVIFKNAHGRLMKTIKRKEGSTVMELAETNFERIEVFFQKPEKEVVGNPYWVGVDVRVLDIQRFSRRKTYQDAFRCYLAERSLALEFEAWEKKNYQTSRVDEIVKNPSVAENKTGGHLAEFLTSKRQNDGCEVPPDGLKNGQKYLVIERQNPEHRAIVAILSLHSASRVRNTSFNDLEIIRSMLAADKYKNITRLAKDKSEYLDRAQSLYYYSLSGYSTGYDGEKIELRPFKRRRTDQGNDLQKSPVEGLSTENQPLAGARVAASDAPSARHPSEATTILNGEKASSYDDITVNPVNVNFDDLPNPLVAMLSNSSQYNFHSWSNVHHDGNSACNWQNLPHPHNTEFDSTTTGYDWDNLPNPLIPTAGRETFPLNWQNLPNPLHRDDLYR